MSEQPEDLQALYKPDAQRAIEELPTGELVLKPMVFSQTDKLEALSEMITTEKQELRKDALRAQRTGQKRVKKWRRMPPEMFQVETEKITDLYLAGVPPEEIASLTPLSNAVVLGLIKTLELKKVAERRATIVAEEVVKKKLPMVQQSVGLSLAIVRDSLLSIFEDEERKKNLSLKEIEALSRIGERINHMLRLELGESTENLTISGKPKYSFDQAMAMIKKLKEVNPIMDYGKEPSIRASSRLEASGGEVPQISMAADGTIETIMVVKPEEEIEPIVIKR